MDNMDSNIVEILKENSRVSASEISRKVGLSVPAVSERIKKLEEQGVIQKYTIKLNEQILGYNIKAFIMVRLQDVDALPDFKAQMLTFPNILECHHIAGEFDYLMKTVVASTDDLEDFITNKLKRIEGLSNCRTHLVFSTLKEELTI